jgi:hypothetical protein
MHLTAKTVAAASAVAMCTFVWEASASAAQGVAYSGPAQPPTMDQPALVGRQQYPLFVYPTGIPSVYVNPAPFGSSYFPWHFGHYHIRDWTTGIEKPSYSVSKPWLDVRQYP